MMCCDTWYNGTPNGECPDCEPTVDGAATV